MPLISSCIVCNDGRLFIAHKRYCCLKEETKVWLKSLYMLEYGVLSFLQKQRNTDQAFHIVSGICLMNSTYEPSRTVMKERDRSSTLLLETWKVAVH